ncbi:MAG: hypothetical protein B5M51_05820 [Anaerolinea sp. 4484_236]|nr:MAG: hypothetical protein B5M51_05820 [Anaerolinea sp. 4484_236]OQY32574.1 MAG: hypothetical protein B6243_07300 [Anaerolineaceae bacterium 4572_5.2]
MLVTRSKSIVDQVNEILRERIRDATYSPGEKIPSESELSAEFSVSRATVRTVLAKLSVEGLILRKQGDGTYVNERIREVNTHLGGLWDFAHLIESSGFTARIQALSMELVIATEEQARALAITPGDELLSMVRLFSADERSAIVANNVIPTAFLTKPMEEVDGELRIREILKEYCDQDVAFAVTDIRSVLAGEEASALDAKPDDHLLNLKMVFYSKNNRPVALGDSYFNDKVLRLRLVQAWN